jgi:hypothetical protein
VPKSDVESYADALSKEARLAGHTADHQHSGGFGSGFGGGGVQVADFTREVHRPSSPRLPPSAAAGAAWPVDYNASPQHHQPPPPPFSLSPPYPPPPYPAAAHAHAEAQAASGRGVPGHNHYGAPIPYHLPHGAAGVGVLADGNRTGPGLAALNDEWPTQDGTFRNSMGGGGGPNESFGSGSAVAFSAVPPWEREGDGQGGALSFGLDLGKTPFFCLLCLYGHQLSPHHCIYTSPLLVFSLYLFLFLSH